MDTTDLILLTMLACTFVLSLGIVLIRKDIEEIKNLIKNK
jgi:hypothetical protein